MVQLEITGVHFELSDKLKKYVSRKIGKLDRYLPARQRTPAQGQVTLTEEDGRSANRYTCEVNITFPHGVVTAKEATVNMYAAVDIVEEKVKRQLLKHKGKQADHGSGRDRRILRRLRRFGR